MALPDPSPGQARQEGQAHPSLPKAAPAWQRGTGGQGRAAVVTAGQAQSHTGPRSSCPPALPVYGNEPPQWVTYKVTPVQFLNFAHTNPGRSFQLTQYVA